jgi:hypothetical protein
VHIWGHSGELERLDLWAGLEHLLETARAAGFVGASVGEFYAPEPQ